jgi:hypothetical protein
VSALGTSAVVDGCLASGADLAWRRLTAQLAQLSPELAHADQGDQAPVSDQPPALDDEAELTQPAGVR